MLTAIRRTLGVWLVALGERIEGVSATPEVGSDAVTA
jgi:hypothetical protein